MKLKCKDHNHRVMVLRHPRAPECPVVRHRMGGSPCYSATLVIGDLLLDPRGVLAFEAAKPVLQQSPAEDLLLSIFGNEVSHDRSSNQT